MATRIILDTDIGDDIDDALCLGLICGCPEFELLGVTTVFANVVARARQARTVLASAGGKFRDIPVFAGCGGSMASRPVHNIRHYLDNVLPNQDPSCYPESQLPPLNPKHAVDYLVDTIMSGNGDIVPVTIGAMTNLAMAIVKDWRIVQRIPRIICMAAEFRHPFAEWNIKCDPEAAHIVFSSGIPMDVIPWEIGDVVTFERSDCDRLGNSKSKLAERLHLAIQAFEKAHHRLPSLFDPMAIATQVQPDLCTWKQGHVKVELQGNSTYGFTTFKEDAAGPHRVAWTADRRRSLDFYFQRVLAV